MFSINTYGVLRFALKLALEDLLGLLAVILGGLRLGLSR